MKVVPVLMSRIALFSRLFRGWWLAATHTGTNVGSGVELAPGSYVQVTDGGSLRIGAGTLLERGMTLTVPAGRLVIGARGYIGPWSTLVATEAIEIGDDCLIAERVTIRDQDHEIRGPEGVAITRAGRWSAPIRIGSDVWIGAGAVILRGVTIGDGAVVAANAVVNRDVAPRSIVGGIPARVLGSRDAARADAREGQPT